MPRFFGGSSELCSLVRTPAIFPASRTHRPLQPSSSSAPPWEPTSRILKKSSSFVLVHPSHEAGQQIPVRGSTVLGTHCSSGCNGCTPPRSLRPCWTAFLNTL